MIIFVLYKLFVMENKGFPVIFTALTILLTPKTKTPSLFTVINTLAM